MMKGESIVPKFDNEWRVKEEKVREKSSRRFQKRLFASVAFVGRFRRSLLMFLAMATLTFALCILAPGSRNFKGLNSIQSSSPNNSDSVLKN
jgi:hypothetical protein